MAQITLDDYPEIQDGDFATPALFNERFQLAWQQLTKIVANREILNNLRVTGTNSTIALDDGGVGSAVSLTFASYKGLAGEKAGYISFGTDGRLYVSATNAKLYAGLDLDGDVLAGGRLGLGGLSGSNYGTYFSAGVEAGNGGLQGYVVPPPGASMALILVQGDRYGGTSGAHNGFWYGMWQQGSNRVFPLGAADSTLGGTAQGFDVIWDGSAIRVVNKSGMAANQSGRVTIQFFGS